MTRACAAKKRSSSHGHLKPGVLRIDPESTSRASDLMLDLAQTSDTQSSARRLARDLLAIRGFATVRRSALQRSGELPAGAVDPAGA